jgi:hypothetical protein
MLAERSDDIEWGTPVLFMRVPDGRIFDLGDDGHGLVAAAPTTRVMRGGGPQVVTRPGQRGVPAADRQGPNIFLNYRPQDTSGHALLLTDRLRQHFGEDNVHGALDSSPDDERRAEIQASGVVLALLGQTWVSSLGSSGAGRHADDHVRRELEWALRDVPDHVIPVLIDTAMPDPETLPRSLRALCRQAPVQLRHASFDSDLAGLIARLERVSAKPARPVAEDEGSDGRVQQPPSVTEEIHAVRAAAGISAPYHDHYADVIGGMLDGGVVPLLGSGIRGPSPLTDQLASPLAEHLTTNLSGLAEVAQRVAVTLGERRLYTAIKDLVAAQSEPTKVHRFLADFPGILRRLGLPPRHQLIISGNYDLGLERAFEDVNEPFDYAVYVASSGWFVHVPWGENAAEPVATTILEPRKYVGFPIDDDGHLDRTIIVKIHGGADGQEGGLAWRNNYVVTEDHYIDYLPTHNIQDHLPIQILDKLTGSRCLFLGYALRDWNSRVFLRRIWRGKPITESSWAIQQDPDPLEKASWSVVGHVELLAAGLPDYVTELRSRLEDSRGQH